MTTAYTLGSLGMPAWPRTGTTRFEFGARLPAGTPMPLRVSSSRVGLASGTNRDGPQGFAGVGLTTGGAGLQPSANVSIIRPSLKLPRTAKPSIVVQAQLGQATSSSKKLLCGT